MRRALLHRIYNFIQELKLINCAGMNDSLKLQKERKTDSSLFTDAVRVRFLSLFCSFEETQNKPA